MNMIRKSIGILLLFILSAAATSYAAQGDDILGVWNNEEKDAKIEIFKCSGKYCGEDRLGQRTELSSRIRRGDARHAEA